MVPFTSDALWEVPRLLGLSLRDHTSGASSMGHPTGRRKPSEVKALVGGRFSRWPWTSSRPPAAFAPLDSSKIGGRREVGGAAGFVFWWIFVADKDI